MEARVSGNAEKVKIQWRATGFIPVALGGGQNSTGINPIFGGAAKT